jgi:hypothetical protein
MCDFKIPDIATLPTSVSGLAREWKRLQAQMQLLSLDVGERAISDEEADRRMGKMLDCLRVIDHRLSDGRPETFDDCADLVEIALEIIEEGGTYDDLEIKMLKRARDWMVQLADERRYKEAA